MLVYGDHREHCDPRERMHEIEGEIQLIRRMPAGLERHSRLVGALVETGKVAQGVADAHAPSEELGRFLHRLARAVVRSHDTRFEDIGELPKSPVSDLPPEIDLTAPEGFAFYAVYPEAYADAARRLKLIGPARVIGIRSIGTTLGAIVAVALDAPPPVTVRPFGDPFARTVDLPPDLIESDVNYVIVDEGPGLSGSSFGSVADRLQDRGVPLDRIAFLPSHPGDLGGRASDAHRERWRRAQRIAAQFNPEFLVDAFGPLEEFSTGGPFERRKFLATHAGERVLLKFAGLGRIGARKLEIARRLFAENLVPEPLDLVHGFIVERWCDDASSVPPSDIPLPKIATYIAARTRLPRAAPDSGASIEELLRMARRNVSLEFGDRAARSLGCWESRVADLQRRVMRILTDNKLDRIEWLRTRDGAVIKTDALDHHCGHDLIGCQDFAWDVAGAIAEFDLDHVSADALIAAVEQFANRRVDRELVDFCLVAYLAFRLGQARLGGQSAVAVRYSDSLHEVLQYTSAAKRLESLVD